MLPKTSVIGPETSPPAKGTVAEAEADVAVGRGLHAEPPGPQGSRSGVVAVVPGRQDAAGLVTEAEADVAVGVAEGVAAGPDAAAAISESNIAGRARAATSSCSRASWLCNVVTTRRSSLSSERAAAGGRGGAVWWCARSEASATRRNLRRASARRLRSRLSRAGERGPSCPSGAFTMVARPGRPQGQTQEGRHNGGRRTGMLEPYIYIYVYIYVL